MPGKPCLLCEYSHAELALKDRTVVKNDHWIALVPWWATWPFEILRELLYDSMAMPIAHLFL